MKEKTKTGFIECPDCKSVIIGIHTKINKRQTSYRCLECDRIFVKTKKK